VPQGLLVHAASRVHDFHEHIGPRRGLFVGLAPGKLRLLEIPDPRMNPDGSSLLCHGLGCVGDEVHEHLLNLTAVRANERQVCLRLQYESRMLGDGCPKKMSVFMD